MSEKLWLEKVKKLAEKGYRKLCRRALGWFGVVAMAMPSSSAARPINQPSDSPKQNNIEQFSSTSEVADNSKNFYSAIKTEHCAAKEEMVKLCDTLSKMSFGDILDKGLVSKEDIQNYNFSSEDFLEMQAGNLGQRLEKRFVSKRLGLPKGRCLEKMRETVSEVWGYNVLSPTSKACDWTGAVEQSEMPVTVVGQVVVDSKTLADEGNIKREDLKLLQNMLVVISGNKKVQPAGHVSLVCAKFDQEGNLVATNSYCDGRENYANVVDQKIGGGQRRYGNKATVMVPNDTKISEGLAQYIATKAMEKCQNMAEIYQVLGIEKEPLQLAFPVAVLDADALPPLLQEPLMQRIERLQGIVTMQNKKPTRNDVIQPEQNKHAAQYKAMLRNRGKV